MRGSAGYGSGDSVLLIAIVMMLLPYRPMVDILITINLMFSVIRS